MRALESSPYDRSLDPDCEQHRHAMAYVALTLQHWRAFRSPSRIAPVVPAYLNLPEVELPDDLAASAADLARELAGLPLEQAAFRLGRMYTRMLPSAFRADMGAFYTPPELAEALLDRCEDAGIKWHQVRVLDPSCGAGCFLLAVARRMLKALRNESSPDQLTHLEKNLVGMEMDPFAGWVSQTIVGFLLEDLAPADIITPRLNLHIGDALAMPADGERFDLVVGNPPFGRVKLSPVLRSRYSRSLFGHANLYGLFCDLAEQWLGANGTLAYIMPTSFLGGQYHKNLRLLLGERLPPVTLTLLADREGVFESVQQELLLGVFSRSSRPVAPRVEELSLRLDGSAEERWLGPAAIPTRGHPWLLPRSAEDVGLIERAGTMPTRLSDLGYRVSTGPLVWNRHKGQLRDRKDDANVPLIWAQCVTPQGFALHALKSQKHPYFYAEPEQGHLHLRESAVLVQRTTAKEQSRRLMAAQLPDKLIADYGSVVVENHLNMVLAEDAPVVSLAVIELLLNSQALDRLFRCLNGSVAVSAYELQSLPLPDPEALRALDADLQKGLRKVHAAARIEAMYAPAAVETDSV